MGCVTVEELDAVRIQGRDRHVCWSCHDGEEGKINLRWISQKRNGRMEGVSPAYHEKTRKILRVTNNRIQLETLIQLCLLQSSVPD